MSDDPLQKLLPAEIYDFYTKGTDEEVAKIIHVGYLMREYAKNLNLDLVQFSKEIAPVKGVIGENYVLNILKPHFRVNCSRKEAKSADIIVNNDILVEVKNYSKIVPRTEVEKFQRDLGAKGAIGGVFVSLYSPIARKKSFEYTQELVRGSTVPTIYISSSNESVILLAVEIIINLTKHIKINTEEIVEKLSDMIESVNSLSMIRANIHQTSCNISKNLSNINAQILEIELKLKNTAEKIAENIDECIKYSDIDVNNIINSYHILHQDEFKHLIEWFTPPVEFSKNSIILPRGGFKFLKTKTQIFVDIPDDSDKCNKLLSLLDLKIATIKESQIWIDIKKSNITFIEKILDTLLK